jgi:hypothetical protein
VLTRAVNPFDVEERGNHEQAQQSRGHLGDGEKKRLRDLVHNFTVLLEMITCSFEQRDRDVHVSSSWRLPADLRDSCLLGTVTNVGQTPSSDRPIGSVTLLCGILALLAVISSLIGLLVMGGAGPQMVTTARGASVIICGEGIYAADSWLLGAGNRGQDVAILLVEVPFLLLTLWWYRRGGTVAAVAMTGVLAFFTYYYVSMTFATAPN